MKTRLLVTGAGGLIGGILRRTRWRSIYRNNVRGAFNALEASRRAGVRRVIVASSNHVTGLYERDEPYASIVAGRYDGLDPETIPLLRTDAPVRPDGYYGAAKVFAEALGRLYAEEHDMSVSACASAP